MLAAGDRVDRYLIERVLGQGGMGQVYVALDPKLDRKVALKVLAISGDAGDESQPWAQRLIREARAAASFNHPNVVAIYDVGEHKQQPFIAMELVLGETLRRHVGKADKSEIAVRLSWLLDVARGLAAAHAQGIVHRDIKPDNVMLTKDGVIKIVDFGIARRKAKTTDASQPTDVAETLTQAGALIGTVRYMAPEQMRGHAFDGRVDQFAWAVMAYELLSGAHPWPGDDFLALATEMLSTRPKPLRALAEDVPENVVQVIERALSAGANDRFATMTDLIDALGSPARDVTSRAPHLGSRGLIWAAAGVGALVIGVIVVVMLSKLVLDRASASASAPAPTPGVALAGFRCSDAVVTGGTTPASDYALARPIGYGACARLALETGLPWAHDKALGAGIDLGALSEATVELSLGAPVRVTVRVAGPEGQVDGQGEGKSPMQAMQAAVAALAPKIAAPPLSEAERAAWGAVSDESARRIERTWRKLVIGDLSDAEAVTRELIKSDGDSPWPHAMKCLSTPPGSVQGREACAGAVERLDRVPPTRAKALRALALFMTQETADEALKLFRQGYRDAPDDPDVAGLYGAIAVDSASEGFGIIDGVAQRFPTYAIVALNNAISGPDVRDAARNKKYIARLNEILPESACGSRQLDELLLSGRVVEARALVDHCVALFGASNDAFPASLLRVRVELAALELDRARELATPLLGDPREWWRIEASNAVIASYMLGGRLGEAEKLLEVEMTRQRDQESPILASQRAAALLRLHVLIGSAPPADLVALLTALMRDNPTLPAWFKLRADAMLAVAPSASRDLAEPAAQAVIASKNPSDVFHAIPLLRKARGDKETLALLQSKRDVPTRTLIANALDYARLLETARAPATDVEAQYRMAILPYGQETVGFEKVIARARLARLLEKQGKKDDAAKLRAELARLLAHADPKVSEMVDRL